MERHQEIVSISICSNLGRQSLDASPYLYVDMERHQEIVFLNCYVCNCVYSVLQGGENALDALDCRSLSAEEPIIR